MSELNPFASPADKPVSDRPVPVLSPPQMVKFQILEEDVIAGAIYANRNSPEVRKMVASYRNRRVLFGLAFLGLAGLLSLSGEMGPFTTMRFAAAFVGAVFLISGAIYPFLAKSLVRKKAKTYVKSGVMPLSEEETRLTVDHDGLRIEEPYVLSHIQWPKINRVRSTQEHLFLFASPASPIAIPLRAFVTEEGFQAFCNLAERLWEEHHVPATTEEPAT